MSQSLAETHVEDLIYECDCITAGDYGESTQEHIDDLMLQMEGFSFPLRCTGSLTIPRDKALDGVKRAKGWLVANMATLTNSGNGTTVSSSSVSQATATFSTTRRKRHSSGRCRGHAWQPRRRTGQGSPNTL